MLQFVPADAPQFRARVVLLGASNLTRGISTAVETLRLHLGSPLEILAALGHGRSFGASSTVAFVRTLPGTLHCGLWDALRDSIVVRPDLPTFALITDIGNDIMYGAPPATIASWIDQCIGRLQDADARIAMTMMPIERLRTIKPWHYAIVKMMLFPTRRITFEQAIARANDLHDRLIDVATHRNVPLIECRSEWYGFDPIHIRLRHWPAAWSDMIGSCVGNRDTPPRAKGSLARWIRLRLLRPEHEWLLRIEFKRPQPAGRLGEGSTISLF